MKLRSAAAALLLAIAASTPSSALQITLTYDSGIYDPTITDPTGEYHGPYDWMESGARIAGFWAEQVGTPSGAFAPHGHTHRALDSGNPTGYAERMHSFTGDLQGLQITLLNDARFDLVSLDYNVQAAVLTDPNTLRLPWSFAPDAPQIIVTDLFDPSASDFESQWTAFAAIDDANWRTHDWHTLSFAGAGFTDLSSLLISQTAGNVWIDNIVIEIHDVMPIPEPSTALLLGLGLIALGQRRPSRE